MQKYMHDSAKITVANECENLQANNIQFSIQPVHRPQDYRPILDTLNEAANEFVTTSHILLRGS